MRAGTVLCALVAALLIGGGARLVYINRAEGAALRARAERQQTARRTIPAWRGDILDTRGRLLATTLRRPSVFVDPGLLADESAIRFAAYQLGPVLGLKPAELEAELLRRKASGTRFAWIKRRISDDELSAFLRTIEVTRQRAFDVQYEPVRVYPQTREERGRTVEAIAPHVLGFCGVDQRPIRDDSEATFDDLHGRAGVEEAWDSLLAGRPGEQIVVVDVVRRPLRAPEEGYIPAEDGATLVLTLDAYIQHLAQRALGKAVEKHKAEWGIAVVLDPQSGEVLAMAVSPAFDPLNPAPPNFHELSEVQKKKVMEQWRNRAITDSYEPGSIFKPFTASLALEEGVTRLDEVFAINGPVRDFGARTIHDTHAYGALTLHEVISKSSNIGMGILGGRLGCERLHRYVRSFGFGDVTGLGLPGEHAGMVLEYPRRWNPSFSPQSVPIGQEIAVTAIQLVSAFSVFCNGGILYRPRILRGVFNADGTVRADYSRPIAIRRVLSEVTAERFRREALVETVVSGTGKSAALKEYQVFGKTGTAQIAHLGGGGYQGGKYMASFIGGAPSDRPRLVVLVSIAKPSVGGYYGGVVAAPVVKEILAETLAYMRVPPELSDDSDAGGLTPGRRRASVAREAGNDDSGD